MFRIAKSSQSPTIRYGGSRWNLVKNRYIAIYLINWIKLKPSKRKNELVASAACDVRVPQWAKPRVSFSVRLISGLVPAHHLRRNISIVRLSISFLFATKSVFAVWRVCRYPSNIRVYTTHSTNAPFFGSKSNYIDTYSGLNVLNVDYHHQCAPRTVETPRKSEICKERSTNFPCALLELVTLVCRVTTMYIEAPNALNAMVFFLSFQNRLVFTVNVKWHVLLAMLCWFDRWTLRAHDAGAKNRKQIKNGRESDRRPNRVLWCYIFDCRRTYSHSPVAYCIRPAKYRWSVRIRSWYASSPVTGVSQRWQCENLKNRKMYAWTPLQGLNSVHCRGSSARTHY